MPAALVVSLLALAGCATTRVTLTERSGLEQQLLARSFERAVARLDTTLAVDQAETLLGVPALHVPVAAVPIPEIPLFKWVRQRGLSEVQVYAYDPATGGLLERVPDAVGRAKYDQFPILLVISLHGERPRRAPAWIGA